MTESSSVSGAHCFVVEAETEESARRVASERKGDEGKDVWLNPLRTSCVELVPDGTEGVWMCDFHAG